MGTLLALGFIGALAGGAMGIAGTAHQSRKEQAQIEQQQKMAWSQYLLGQEYSDTQFDLQNQQGNQMFALQHTEAAAQLDSQQDRLNAQQLRMGEDLARGTEQLNTGLLNQAYGIQNAQIQTAGSIGTSLAAEGASGTRDSSGGGLMRAYEQQSLDRGIALQFQQNDQQLAALRAQANNASQDIGFAQEDISRERLSWMEGGYRLESKQAQDTYAEQSKLAQDTYNRKMAELGQSNLSWQYDQAKAGPMDYLMGAFSGMSSGFSLGTTIYDFSQKTPNSFNSLGGAGYGRAGYGRAGAGYTNNGMSTDWRIR